jgi:hypothetical protein
LHLLRLPEWLNALNEFRLRMFRKQIRTQEIAGFLRDMCIML